MANVTLTLGAFDDGAVRYARAVDKSLRTWGFEVERRAKQKSPVDTGFNSNSIYTVTPDGKIMANGREVGVRPGDPNAPSSKRKKYRPGQFAQQAPIGGDGGGTALFAVVAGKGSVIVYGGDGRGPGQTATMAAPSQMTCEVRVGAEYAIYLEMGTVKMAARPFLGPAAEEVTPMMDGMLQRNLKAEGLL